MPEATNLFFKLYFHTTEMPINQEPRMSFMVEFQSTGKHTSIAFSSLIVKTLAIYTSRSVLIYNKSGVKDVNDLIFDKIYQSGK